MALATAKRSPEGSPPRDCASAAPTSSSASRERSIAARCATAHPAESEQRDARRLRRCADRGGHRYRCTDDERGGAGPTQLAEQRRHLLGSSSPTPSTAPAAAHRRVDGIVDHDTADLVGPSGSPSTRSSRWRRGCPGRGRGWRAAWSCWRARRIDSRRSGTRLSLLRSRRAPSAPEAHGASSAAVGAPSEAQVGRPLTLPVGVEEDGEEVGVSDGSLRRKESSRVTGWSGRSTIGGHPCSSAMPWLGVRVATSWFESPTCTSMSRRTRRKCRRTVLVGDRLVLTHVGVAARRHAEPLTEEPVGELPVEGQGALDVRLEADPNRSAARRA